MKWNHKKSFIDAETGELISPYKLRTEEYLEISKSKIYSQPDKTKAIILVEWFVLCRKNTQITLWEINNKKTWASQNPKKLRKPRTKS